MLDSVTPLILTYNEAPNIRRTLEKLTWAREILIVDSFSTDETLTIAKSFPQVRIVRRKFDTFANQCNFGLEQIKTEWVLSLDADYVLSDDLSREIAELKPDAIVAGYRAGFTFLIYGRKLRASLYPPRTVLYRKALAKYHDEGHSHRVQIGGNVVSLNATIFHDDRKPLDRWLSAQNKYAMAEAKALNSTAPGNLNLPDRIRRHIIFAPALVLLYTLFVNGVILDGWAGWFYVAQRTIAELIISLRLLQVKLESKECRSGSL